MRKLSKLQKWALRAALDQHIREGADSIQYWQIKEEYFHLPPAPAGNYGWWFSKKHTPGYNAAAASVSRTAKRLKQRGLATVRREGGSYASPRARERRPQDVAIAPTTAGFALAALIELETPGAFGFKPLTRSQLDPIINESKRTSAEERDLERFFGRPEGEAT